MAKRVGGVVPACTGSNDRGERAVAGDEAAGLPAGSSGAARAGARGFMPWWVAGRMRGAGAGRPRGEGRWWWGRAAGVEQARGARTCGAAGRGEGMGGCRPRREARGARETWEKEAEEEVDSSTARAECHVISYSVPSRVRAHARKSQRVKHKQARYRTTHPLKSLARHIGKRHPQHYSRHEGNPLSRATNTRGTRRRGIRMASVTWRRNCSFFTSDQRYHGDSRSEGGASGDLPP